MVLDFLAVDNFDFTRKIVKKKFGENVGSFVNIDFLEKKLIFRTVCLYFCVRFFKLIFFFRNLMDLMFRIR